MGSERGGVSDLRFLNGKGLLAAQVSLHIVTSLDLLGFQKELEMFVRLLP